MEEENPEKSEPERRRPNLQSEKTKRRQIRESEKPTRIILPWKGKFGKFLTCLGVRFCPARRDKDQRWEPATVRIHFSYSTLGINIYSRVI